MGRRVWDDEDRDGAPLGPVVAICGLALALLLAGLIFGSCGPVPPPPVIPQPPPVVVPPTPDDWHVDVVACASESSPCDAPIAGASIQFHYADGYKTQTANADGYTIWTVPEGFLDSDVIIVADGYVETRAHIDVGGTHDSPQHNIIHVPTAHVDPSSVPLGTLAQVRGAMWPLGTASTCGALPFGPRPGQADNVIATVFLPNYSTEQQECIVAELRARGYTHAVVGPLVDSDGYHGIWTPNDWRGANWERFLDTLQFLWDHGLTPVVFIHPDNWTLEQTQAELTPLLRTPRAQRLIRVAVPAGWEPTRYGWSSCTWAAFAQWGRQTLPNALILLHTVTDVDAPAGSDERCNDDDKHWNPDGNAGAWNRVAPYLHGWLTQSAAFETPDVHGDPNHSEKTNFDNWQDNFRAGVSYSYANRFHRGYAGWPTSSAWGAGIPLLIYAGEYSAYWKFWAHRSEAEGVKWGDAAMAAGADGYLDSGSVTVPRRR